MIWCVAIILLICLYKVKCSTAKGQIYFKDYTSFEKTTSIKGIFILLIFVSHSYGYLTKTTKADFLYADFYHYFGQMVVTMFLFYSGYGILEAVTKKGYGYIKQFPKNRILKVLVHFNIAILIYAIINAFFGDFVDIKTLLLAFTGWVSIGNSNWYIFDILCAYLITYIAFSVCKKNKIWATVLTTVLTIGFVFLMKKYQNTLFYNTILCFPFGMWFSLFKNKFEKAITKNRYVYFLCLILAAVAFNVLNSFRSNVFIYIIASLAFSIFIVELSMFLSLNNKILFWFGKHLFPIYIFMRIPMNILESLGLTTNKFVFVSVSFVSTIILAVAFQKVFDIMDKSLFKKPKAFKIGENNGIQN